MPDLSLAADAIRQNVTARMAAEALGVDVDRGGRCRCPIHNGQDRNMRFFAGGAMFKCFVCGASGDCIKLVRQMNGWGFKQALEWLNSTFSLGLDMDMPMDKNAKEHARKAAEQRRIAREQREQVEQMEHENMFDADRLVIELEDMAERYAPEKPGDVWDERFVYALKRIADVRELSERTRYEVGKRD